MDLTEKEEAIPIEGSSTFTPQIFLGHIFPGERMNITIQDTVLQYPSPDSVSAMLTTCSGDTEEIHLQPLTASWVGDYDGYGYSILLRDIEFLERNNGILEVDFRSDKITVLYQSYNGGKPVIFSVPVGNTAIHK